MEKKSDGTGVCIQKENPIYIYIYIYLLTISVLVYQNHIIDIKIT